MKKTYFVWAVLALVALACSQEPGPEFTNYYVSPSGSDKNTGLSEAEAFASLEQAAAILSAGCTVFVMPGTYEEEVIQEAKGREDAPIVWIAFDSAQIPVIKGKGGGGWSETYGLTLDRADHTHLVMLKATDFSFGLYADSCTGLLVDRCVANDNFKTGILIEKSTNVVVRHCSARNNAVNNSKGEGNGIWAEDCYNVLFDADTGNGNGAEPWGGTGLQFFKCHGGEMVSGVADSNRGNGILIEDCTDIVVRGNTCFYNFADFSFDDWWCGGIWVDGGHDITVEQNLFAYTEGADIEISDEDSTDPTGYIVRNNVCIGGYWGIWIGGLESGEVYCNTVVDNTEAGIWVSDPNYYPGPAKNVTVVNNIVSMSGKPGLLIDAGSCDATCSFDYNLYHNTSGSVVVNWEGNIVSFDSYVVSSGWGTHSLEANPEFSDRNMYDYQLEETSPAVDAGWDSFKPDIDFDGNPRTGHCDIGAFEYIPSGFD